MNWITRLPEHWQDRRRDILSGWGRMSTIRGTIQRINYLGREMRVIAQGRVWQFGLAADCQLWLNETPAILRSFHPLDPVKVLYQEQGAGYLARAIYVWERCPSQR
jgi:hypothetical protein